MNPVLQQPETSPLLNADEKDSLSSVSLHLVKSDSINRATDSSFRHRTPLIRKVANSLIQVLPICGFALVAALWLGTSNVIEGACYKALMVILLLLQMRSLSHSIKQ